MHELGITRNLVAIVADAAKGRTVTRVNLDVGELSGIMADAISFCFDVVVKGTAIEGASLAVRAVPGRGECLECGAAVEMPSRITACVCGSRRIHVSQGEDIKIASMELQEVA